MHVFVAGLTLYRANPANPAAWSYPALFKTRNPALYGHDLFLFFKNKVNFLPIMNQFYFKFFVEYYAKILSHPEWDCWLIPKSIFNVIGPPLPSLFIFTPPPNHPIPFIEWYNENYFRSFLIMAHPIWKIGLFQSSNKDSAECIEC